MKEKAHESWKTAAAPDLEQFCGMNLGIKHITNEKEGDIAYA